jgi:hypothetical protein
MYCVLRMQKPRMPDIAHALLKGRESAVRDAARYRQVGAPRIVMGIGVRADFRDADEKRGMRRGKPSLAPTPFGAAAL